MNFWVNPYLRDIYVDPRHEATRVDENGVEWIKLCETDHVHRASDVVQRLQAIPADPVGFMEAAVMPDELDPELLDPDNSAELRRYIERRLSVFNAIKEEHETQTTADEMVRDVQAFLWDRGEGAGS